MTYDEYRALQPGDIIREKTGRRLPRLVLSKPGNTNGGRSLGHGPIALLKIGHSWTDPRRTAWYDAWVIVRRFITTGRKGCTIGACNP